MWVGLSTRRKSLQNETFSVWDGQHGERLSDAVHAQLPIARHHGVPFVSILDGIGPFSSPDSVTWLTEKFYCDQCCHPTPLGHKLSALAIMQFLKVQHAHTLLGQPWRAGSQSPLYCPREPKLADSRDISLYVDSHPLHIYTTTQSEVDQRTLCKEMCVNWSVFEDVRGKPGLISNITGAQCCLVVHPDEVKRHLVVGELHVLGLKSYSNTTGVGTVAVIAAQAGAQCGSTQGETVGTSTIDFKWDQHASEISTDVIYLSKPAAADTTLLICILNVGPLPTKVKIHKLTLF
ncbi:hypothetical protein TSOC_003240 [Tetrabaena socialis]|uniref:Uncharacterized protein n=1 Tax=Tetrabaena socialis TaxID=47790 RepID=A0A2J8AC30_9CHLO|nr:hypothetical protein TSOC_003240 [Tetrabaena socialis]|eukprot:PNH10075.1 hypothetical protein TSOC_003240 [Tetrabaena socialis]